MKPCADALWLARVRDMTRNVAREDLGVYSAIVNMGLEFKLERAWFHSLSFTILDAQRAVLAWKTKFEIDKQLSRLA